MAVKKVKPRPLLLFALLGIILVIIGLCWLHFASPVDRNDNSEVELTITSGMSTIKIGNILKEERLIRSKNLFCLYTKLYSNKSLKAGTYKLKRSMDLNQIVSILEKGSTYSPDSLKLTFKEGQRITDYAKVISDNTFYSYADVIAVFRDNNYMQELINKYWFLTNNIMQDGIYYSLEGYLAPDTYYFEKNVTVKEIIEKMLDEEENRLSNYETSLETNTHYYLTMASIIELEGKNLEDRKNIMGVFNNRIRANMHLGSDVTTYYAFQVPLSAKLTTTQYNTSNPYNTRPTSKLGPPIGPICNPSIISIEAALNPTNNNYLYFVADSTGKVYYSKTNDEQNKIIRELISQGKWNG